MIDVNHYVAEEILRDGRHATIRTMRADDRERVAAAIRQLDRESIYTRLFTYRKELTEAGLTRIMTVDPEREAALLVTIDGPSGEIVIGSARYVAGDARADGRTAEIAFVVEEDYQGLGIAGRLLKHLAAIARERGITEFEADVLPDNKAMLSVFARSGLPMRQRREGGVSHVELALTAAA